MRDMRPAAAAFLLVCVVNFCLFGGHLFTQAQTTRVGNLRGLTIRQRTDDAPPHPPAMTSASPSPPAVSQADSAACCALQSPPPLNITLDYPVKMPRPIRVLFRTGNFDGTWPCDVPCEYTTSEPSGSDRGGSDGVDMIIGEGGPPTISAALHRANPKLSTGARSMESAVNYPALKHLGEQVAYKPISLYRRKPTAYKP